MAKALGTILALRMALHRGSVPPPGLELWRLTIPTPQVFYWSHLSYLAMWLLLILHGPNFWKWLLVPGILFFLEKAFGLTVSRMAALSIVEVNLLPSKVRRGPEGPRGVRSGGVQQLGTLSEPQGNREPWHREGDKQSARVGPASRSDTLGRG